MHDRKYKRIHLACQAEVLVRDHSFSAFTENLSLNGVYIRTYQKISVGERCGISLKLPIVANNAIVNMNCEVVRNNVDGIALQFKSVDHDSFSCLKTFINRKSSYSHNNTTSALSC